MFSNKDYYFINQENQQIKKTFWVISYLMVPKHSYLTSQKDSTDSMQPRNDQHNKTIQQKLTGNKMKVDEKQTLTLS